MNYIELDISLDPLIPYREVAIALLAETGFESFVETENGLKAYINESAFSSDLVESLSSISDSCELEWVTTVIEHQNWNAEWEKEYKPVLVADNCVIRALFHDAMPQFEYEIIVQPQMSFGTGHHPTTLLMMQSLLEFELKGEKLVDLGTGTGVLAILAEKKGALVVLATDIEDHIVENARENVRHNDCVNIRVDKADMGHASSGHYGFILANINLNTLLEGFPSIVAMADEGSTVLMSGFYETDAPELISKAHEYGLQFIRQKTHERWASVEFKFHHSAY